MVCYLVIDLDGDCLCAVCLRKLQVVEIIIMSVIQVDGAPVALWECLPLNPVRFSVTKLAEMEKVSPSALGDVSTGNKVI